VIAPEGAGRRRRSCAQARLVGIVGHPLKRARRSPVEIANTWRRSSPHWPSCGGGPRSNAFSAGRKRRIDKSRERRARRRNASARRCARRGRRCRPRQRGEGRSGATGPHELVTDREAGWPEPAHRASKVIRFGSSVARIMRKRGRLPSRRRGSNGGERLGRESKRMVCGVPRPGARLKPVID